MKELVEKVAALYADFSKDANAQIENEGISLHDMLSFCFNAE